MKTWPWWYWVIGVLVVVVALEGGLLLGRATSPKGTQGEGESTTTASETEASESVEPEVSGEEPATSGETQTVRVYLARGEHLGVVGREIPKTKAVATAAVKELLAGPNAEEQAWGFSTAVPHGTKLLGLTIANGTAVVDLSGQFESGGGSLSMMMRLAQVVYTLTQFSSVQRVEFRLDGAAVPVFGGEGIELSGPQTRGGYEYVLPAIFVESPLPGQRVESPIRITGTANTFEAMFVVRVEDPAGNVLNEGPVQATSGTGTRGTFDASITYPLAASGAGAIVVYEESAKDGSFINEVRIPLR